MKQKGFTLIELMLVLALIVVFAGLAVPRFKRTFLDLELKNTVFSVYKLFLFAREKAATQGHDFQVTFNSQKKTYTLMEEVVKEGQDATITEKAQGFKKAQGRAGKTMKFPEQATVTTSKENFTCYPDGNCDTGTIKIKGAESTYEIVIDELGSSVQMREI